MITFVRVNVWLLKFISKTCHYIQRLTHFLFYFRRRVYCSRLCSVELYRFLPRCMECRRGLAMRILSVRLSVCPSVRLSVYQTRALWQKGRKICPDFYTIRQIIYSLVFWKKWLVGATPSTWNFGSTGPRWSKIADFEPIFARSASAVTPSKKSSINTNRKSTTRFPMSLKRSLPLSPTPKGVKNAKRPFSF